MKPKRYREGDVYYYSWRPVGVSFNGQIKKLMIRKGIPKWYLTILTAPAFVLYPITVKKKSLGLIYADRETGGKVISGNQINYMKTLCNQAMLAIKQSR